MPVITIGGNDGISIEKKREMIKKVSEVVAELMICLLKL